MSLDWYFQMMFDSLAGVLTLAAVMLCFALWVNRRDLRAALLAIGIRPVAFNVCVYGLDLLFFLAPLSALSALVIGASERGGLMLFLPVPTGIGATVVCGVAAVFLGDFFAYWRHRLEHVGWFWKAHVMHHSDRHMNWTTIYRFHPINRVTTTVIDGVAIAAIGFPWWAVLLNSLVRHYYGAFVHINQPWTLGWLGHILVSPAMHRWHHVLEGEGVGKNFASVFSIFDRLFGTYYCPGPCKAELGVPGVGDHELIRQYMLPFKIGDNPG